MAIRQFKIPGKIINGSPSTITTGNPGAFGLDLNNTAGLTVRMDDLNGGIANSKVTIFLWYHPLAAPVSTPDYLFIVRAPFADEGSTNSAMELAVNTNLSLALNTDESKQAPANTSLRFTTPASVLTLNAWNSIMISLDYTEALVDDAVKFYVNDTQMVNQEGLPQYETGEIAFDRTNCTWDFYYGPQITPTLDGYVSDVWADIGTFMDFDNSANRRLFIDATGRPVNLGAFGQGPTGTNPTLYLANPAGLYNINNSGNANFRFYNGTIDVNAFTAAGTDPATGTLA